MRLEEIEKEAKLFDRDGECYIHMERCKDGAYGLIVTGDLKVIIQGLFNLMITVEDEYDFPFNQQMKMLRKARKMLGSNDRNKVKRSGGSLQDEQKTDASFLFHSFLIAALPPQQDKPLFSSGKQH